MIDELKRRIEIERFKLGKDIYEDEYPFKRGWNEHLDFVLRIIGELKAGESNEQRT